MTIKERPILFSGPMVRALLDGSKTQTRRVVNLPHANPLGQWEPTTIGGPNGGRTAAGETIPLQGGIWHTRTGDSFMCPHGQPGDRLWVRETWNTSALCLPPIEAPFIYAADLNTDGRMFWAAKWKPSIHMPRAASRITLEVTGVRVERLQEIGDGDIYAEGVDCPVGYLDYEDTVEKAREDFRALWDSLAAPESDWSANPWVWVVEFKRLTT